MKKLILLGLVIMISSCGRTNYKKSKTGILGPNSQVCEQSEVCTVNLTNKNPVQLNFSVRKTGKEEYYDVFQYDSNGNQIGYLSQIRCSSDLDCKIMGLFDSVNDGTKLTINTTNRIPEQSTVRVFKR